LAQLTGNDRLSPTTPPPLSITTQPSLLLPAREQPRKKNLKEKYHIDDLELKNTIG